ncbi:hypothetical protein [Nannocystis sp. SCPEA4]|uniref:hypothetical protein n=1 Tax=Nannocystis sp. SCPEA4 TaxID=2996787 RepID=UPI00226D8A83|nr:hypothetical protein [Nannocystis sp. SCPEA4]MCY1053666.1 hypothetical protein [Nannocystis sp. SCPEA4]
MTVDPARFGRTAAVLARGPLGLLALCLVFSYGVANMFGSLAVAHLTPGQRDVLLGFVVVFPFVVFAGLFRLITHHHTKLYAPADFRDERHFVAVGRRSPERLTPVSSPALVEPVVHGDDFVMIDVAPPANTAPRSLCGFWTRDRETYYVTRQGLVYLLRSPAQQAQITRVDALPDGCSPIASQHCDSALCALAEVADSRAG